MQKVLLSIAKNPVVVNTAKKCASIIIEAITVEIIRRLGDNGTKV